MRPILNPAFDFLRQHFNVSEDVLTFVGKILKSKFPEYSNIDVLAVFEKAVAGDYGKVYKADAQTIIGWLHKHRASLKKDNNLEQPCLPVHTKITDASYPVSRDEWRKEVNRCFLNFRKNKTYTHIHPDVYTFLVQEGKVQLGALRKYCPANYPEGWDTQDGAARIAEAQQRAVADYFTAQEGRGVAEIYSTNSYKSIH